MTKKPDILATNILAQTKIFTVEGMHLHFSNGEERQFERIKIGAGAAVMIVPMLDDHTILLIREYAAGIGEYVMGFPKGAVEKGEDLCVDAHTLLGS